MSTYRASRALAVVLATGLVAVAAMAGTVEPAGAQVVPGTSPPPVLCPSHVPPPQADLGVVPTPITVSDPLPVVADQSSGLITEQSVRIDRGTTWVMTVSWEGLPGPDKWVTFYPNEPGLYTVTLTVTDCRERVDTDTRQVRVFGVIRLP
jgi:hypothetical protein